MTSSLAPVTTPAGGPTGYLAKIARGALFNLVGSIVSAVATFAFAVVVTRTAASQAEAGVFFSLSSLFLVGAAVARLGVPVGLVYFLARYRTTGDQHLIKALVRLGVVVTSALALGMAVVGLALAGPLSDAFLGTREHGAVALVRVLSCALVFSALTDVGVGATRGMGVMRPLVLVDRIGRPVGQVLLAVLLALAGVHSALGLGIAWAFPWVPASAIVLVWTRRLRLAAERPETPSSSELAPGQRASFWRFTGPRSISGITQLALQRTDIILIGALRGPRDAAIYTAATRFLVFGQLLSNSIGQTIQPKLAQLMVLDDRKGARGVYRASTVWLVLSSWPVYLLSAIFAKELLTVFGHGYRTGSAIIVILSLVMLFATATGSVDTVLVMAGRSSWTMLNSSGALAVDLGLNVLLIPRIGIIGAAIAWAAAIAFNNLLPLVQLALSMQLHPFGAASTAAAALAAVCYGVLPLLIRLAVGGGFAVLVGSAVLCTVPYAVVLWRWRGLFELPVPRQLRRGRRQAAA